MSRWPLLVVVFALAASGVESLRSDPGPAPAAAMLGEEPFDPSGVPAPFVLSGRAMAVNPLHTLTCMNEGIDGKLHRLPADVSGWDFGTNDDVVVYFHDAAGRMATSADPATVPSSAVAIEVCNDALLPTDYDVVFSHPDWRA